MERGICLFRERGHEIVEVEAGVYRLPGLVMQALQGETELTEEQKEHADKRNLFAKAEAKITAQKAMAEARAEKKTENQK